VDVPLTTRERDFAEYFTCAKAPAKIIRKSPRRIDCFLKLIFRVLFIKSIL
jgi:hypothetical protein